MGGFLFGWLLCIFDGSGIIGGEIIHEIEMLDTLILLWVLGWSTWYTLIHDGGCAGRDCLLVNLCGYRLTLCNVYKWEIVEVMSVAHIV